MRLLRSMLALAGLAVAGAFQAPAIQMEVMGGETRLAERNKFLLVQAGISRVQSTGRVGSTRIIGLL